MSLLNRNFMTAGGEPVTGRTPTQIIVNGGVELTPQQRATVEHAYKLFCDNVRLSPAANGYHVQNRQLPDGTMVRMESNNSVDRVMVWPEGSEEEEFATFFGIPFDETYVNALTGASGELAKEPVFYIPRVILNKTKPQAILNGLKLATDHGMYPLITDPYKKKPSQPGNTTWYAKNDKRSPILSWWGQYSRYSNSALQRGHWSQKVWGRSLLVNNMFYTDEYTAYLQKYPPAYNSDYAIGGSSTFANPNSTLGNANNLRDYLWISGVRVKTGIVTATAKYILSACIGTRSGAKVVRVCIGTVYPTAVVEVALAKVISAAKNGTDLDYAADFTSYTITPTLPAQIGVASNLINEMAQPPYWNKSGSECAGIVNSYFQSGVSEITFYLYKIAYSDATEAFEASIVEYATQTESWSNSSGGRTVTGSVTTGNVAIKKGTYSDSRPATFTGSISASKPIAVDYDGDEIVIVRATYNEELLRNSAFTSAYSGDDGSTTATLNHSWTCYAHSHTNTWTTSSAAVWSGTQSYTKAFLETRSITQGSVLLKNDTPIITRNRTYSMRMANDVQIDGTGTGTHVISEVVSEAVSAHDDLGDELGLYTRDVDIPTYAYDETYTRTMSIQESDDGVASDFSIVGDLRTGVFVVHETPIVHGFFAVTPPSGYFGDSLNQGISTNNKSGSYSLSVSDSISCTGTCSKNPSSTLGKDHTTADTFSHTVSGSMNYTIPADNGAVSLVIGDVVTRLDTAAYPSASAAIESRTDHVTDPCDSALNKYVASTSSMYSVQNPYGIGSNCFAGALVIPPQDYSKFTIGYTYSNNQATNAVFNPPSSNSDPVEVSYLPASLTTGATATVTTSGGTYPRRFSNQGFTGYTGAGGEIYYTVASSASTKNGFATYIGYQTETLIQHNNFLQPYVVKLDLWVVDGKVVIPSKEYPLLGAYKMFSCPVFV